MVRYKKSASTVTNELERYFQYPSEDFDHCDLVQWWYKRRQDMPNLYRLARDIMTIPGKCLALLDMVLIAYPFPVRFCCLRGAYIFIWQGFGLFETFQIAPGDNSDLDVSQASP